MRWKTKNGYVYKHICKNYRVDTLFDNLRKLLISVNKEIFNLHYNEFSKILKEA